MSLVYQPMHLEKRTVTLASSLLELTSKEQRSLARLLFIISKQAISNFSPKSKKVREGRAKIARELASILNPVNKTKIKLEDIILDLKPYPDEDREYFNGLYQRVTSCLQNTQELLEKFENILSILPPPSRTLFPAINLATKNRRAGLTRKPRTEFAFKNLEGQIHDLLDLFLVQAVILLQNSAIPKAKTVSYSFLSQFLKTLLPEDVQRTLGPVSAEALRNRVRSYQARYGKIEPDSPQKIHRLATLLGWTGKI